MAIISTTLVPANMRRTAEPFSAHEEAANLETS